MEYERREVIGKIMCYSGRRYCRQFRPGRLEHYELAGRSNFPPMREEAPPFGCPVMQLRERPAWGAFGSCDTR